MEPILLLALIFAALIHDVQHFGVRNTQLALENHQLAILYNDQSIQEKNAISVAFSELRKNSYTALRAAMFPTDACYRTFRLAVISAVLSTDLASPEQTSLTNSKWKEAFRQPRKKKNTTSPNHHHHLPLQVRKNNRRGSNCSEMSDVTTDVCLMNTTTTNPSPRRRRSSADGFMTRRARRLSNDSYYNYRRRKSMESYDEESSDLQDSIDFNILSSKNNDDTSACPDDSFVASARQLIHKKIGESRGVARTSSAGSYSAVSFAADSIGVNNKRLDGAKMTRSRTTVRRTTPPPVPGNEPDESSAESSSRNSSPRRRVITVERPRIMTRTPSTDTSVVRFRKRLGIRRSMDLSGESIEIYSKSGGGGTISEQQQPVDDMLCSHAILEVLLRVADVAHYFQSWNIMIRWSNRMFAELQSAHRQNRGHDPLTVWYESQSTILESYILRLAGQMDEILLGGGGDFYNGVVQAQILQWRRMGRRVVEELLVEEEKLKGG